MKKQIFYFNDNYCISCGIQIPEGIMVCKNCLTQEENDDLTSTEKQYNKYLKKQNMILKHI